MSESLPVQEHLSDSDLLAEVKRLAGSERLAVAKLVSVLHLAEHAAFNRIEPARAARR
jgi:hypothetical protein